MLWKMVAVVNAVVLLGAFVAHEAGLWSLHDSPTPEVTPLPADEPDEIVIDVPVFTEVDPNTSASWNHFSAEQTKFDSAFVGLPGSKSSVKMPPVMLGGSKSRVVATQPVQAPNPPPIMLSGSKFAQVTPPLAQRATPPKMLSGSKSGAVAAPSIVQSVSPPVATDSLPTVLPPTVFFRGSKSAPVFEEILMQRLLAHVQRIDATRGSVFTDFQQTMEGTSASWQPASMSFINSTPNIRTITTPPPAPKPKFFSGSKALAPAITSPPKMLPGSKSFNPNAVPPAKQQRLLPGSKSEEVARPQAPGKNP